MDLLCTKDTGNPEGHYFWISVNGKDGLFEFWRDIYGKIKHNLYIPENNKVVKVEEIKINNPFIPIKIFTHDNTLILEHYGWCGADTMDYLFFDCSNLENIRKLKGYLEDYQINKKIKFKDNNIISITSYGDDHVGIDTGVYQYKIKKDVYQRNGNQLNKIKSKQYEIEPDQVRYKRYEIQCELIRSGVIPRPYG